MSKFSASDAAFAGFRLVREHPKAVGLWAVGLAVLSLVTNALTIHFAGPQMAELMTMRDDNSASPEEVFALLGRLTPLLVVSLVYSLILYSVMLAAVNRMVLRPSESRSAFLRLGADELRQAWALILVNLLMFGLYLGVSLVFGVVLGVAIASGAAGMGGLVGLIGFVGVCCTLIYFAVRLSFVSVITFDSGKVAIKASWRATKGHVSGLLGTYLLAVIMGVIVYLLVMMIVAALGAIVSGGITDLGGLFEPDLSSLDAFFTPIGVLRAVFSGLISVLTTLIIFAPAPTIYQMLRDGGDEAVEG